MSASKLSSDLRFEEAIIWDAKAHCLRTSECQDEASCQLFLYYLIKNRGNSTVCVVIDALKKPSESANILSEKVDYSTQL